MISRIGFIGTSSTGKSTLVKKIADSTGLQYIEEDARSLYEEKLKDPTWKREDPTNQLAFQYEIYTLKIRKELNAFHTGFVADRTYLDNFMYFMYYCHPLIDEDLCLYFEQISKAAMSNYTYLFTMNLGSIPYKQDEIRTETYCGALLFETSLHGLIQRWGLADKIIHVPCSNLQERIKFILSYIQK